MADEEFSTGASLHLTVDESSLRTAEQTIADRLGDVAVTVDVDAGAGGPAPDGGTASQSLARSTGNTGPSITGGSTASEPEGVGDTLTAILEVEEAALEELEDIGPGGGVFGEGGVVSTLIEAGGGLAGDAAGVGAEAIGNTVGPAVGTAVGSALGDLVTDGAASGSVSVTRPEWVPLGVEDPGTVPVEDTTLDVDVDAPDAVPVEDAGMVPVEQPTLPVEQPTLGVDDPSPLSVEPVEPIPVDAPDEIPVESPESGGGSVSISVGSSGGPGGPAPPLANAPLSRHITEQAKASGEVIPGLGHVAGGLSGIGTFIGDRLGGDRITPGDAGFRGNPETEQQRREALRRRREQFYGPSNGDNAQGRVDEVDITVEYDVEMGDINIEDINHRRLKREIEREQKKQREEAIRRLERRFE